MKWTCVALFCSVAVLADNDWLDVNTVQGPVRGRKHSNGQLYEFYNIPYATGPTGQNKFKAPLPPPRWSERFNATNEVITICPQDENTIATFLDKVEMKEDCLVANVFVPVTTETNLPVFVYVHGGAFQTGYGSKDTGIQFMAERKDFIMITFNYRLGVHGFLCLGTEDVPGNAGMKDQVALLRWVQDNIASFGGNPNDVTLGGSSAGSSSVDLLMLSKSAEGLFHRLIPESGGNLAVFAIQRDPLENARTFARSLTFANIDDVNPLEQFYKTAPLNLPTTHLFTERSDFSAMFTPCVERDTGDGAFLTESPLSILKKGNYRKLPVLYGFANMEGLMFSFLFDIVKHAMNEKFSDFLPADLEFKSDAEKEEVADKVKKFYFGDTPVNNDQILNYINFYSDILYTHSMLWAAKLQVEAGNNRVYLYEYSFVDDNSTSVPYTDLKGADHCAQSMAWLDSIGLDESQDTPEYKKMRQVVREIWHNFIKTGMPVPTGSSLPPWPSTGADRSPHMELNEKLTLGGVLLEERTRFWEKIYEKHYRDAIPPASDFLSNGAQTNMFSLFALYILFHLIRGIFVESYSNI